ncbi:hypothetical protein TNCV_4041991 [Trichonephila clavipes]|nr:hypothetical protein TNCV_4041991 [Trichonephila clavipes]
MPKMQTCITCMTAQLVTTELFYECITCSFLINECWITEIFNGYIVHFVNTFVSLHHYDACRRRPIRSPTPEENFLNIVGDRLESRTRAVAHHVIVSHQNVSKLSSENRLHTSPIFREYNL